MKILNPFGTIPEELGALSADLRQAGGGRVQVREIYPGRERDAIAWIRSTFRRYGRWARRADRVRVDGQAVGLDCTICGLEADL